MKTDLDTDELRGQTPLTTLAVLDAVCAVRPGCSRIKLVNEILAQWAEQKQAEAVAIERCMRGLDTRK